MNTLPPREYKEISISVPWGHIAGRWYGNRHVRPILALHGWLNNIGTWDTLVPLLPTHIGILCIDLPGHGRSSWYPRGILYRDTDFIHVIVHIIREYKWQKVSLMGHSMGAKVCFLYASIYPKTVDLLIAFDLIKPPYRSPDAEIKLLYTKVNGNLIEDERVEQLALYEPPTFTYAELEHKQFVGTMQSLDLEHCKYLLHRAIKKSIMYPDKYYISRDNKMKYYFEFNGTREASVALAKRIRNIPYFVIKGANSNFINEQSNEVIKILRKNNPHFEMHTIADGSHYVHLNQSAEVARLLNPFINQHRAATLNSWALDEENFESTKKIVEKKQRNWIVTAQQHIQSKL